MRRTILRVVTAMLFIGGMSWAQMQPASAPLPQPPGPSEPDILIEYVLPPFPFEEPAPTPPIPLLLEPQGINNFSVNLGEDLSVNLARDMSEDISTNLAVDLSEDISTNLAVNYGRDLSTNLSVSLGQNLGTPTWR